MWRRAPRAGPERTAWPSLGTSQGGGQHIGPSLAPLTTPQLPSTLPAAPHPRPRPSLHTPTQAAGGRLGTWHGERLGKSVESRAPGDLPGRDVGQHKAQLVQQVPQLAASEGEKGRETRSLRAGVYQVPLRALGLPHWLPTWESSSRSRPALSGPGSKHVLPLATP